jgi:hypothetical protein
MGTKSCFCSFVVRIAFPLLFNGLLCLFFGLEIHTSGISPAENTRLAAVDKPGAKTIGVLVNHNTLRLKMLTIPANLFHYQRLQLLIYNLERGVKSIPSLCPSSGRPTGVEASAKKYFFNSAKDAERQEETSFRAPAGLAQGSSLNPKTL